MANMETIMQPIKTIGVVVFDGIERLDIEGPLGVFGWTAKVTNSAIDLRLMSKHGRSIRDHLIGREIQVDGATADHERFDLLLIPGGDRSRFEDDGILIKEVGRLAENSMLVASVCTGAFLVAPNPVADQKTMVTHHMAKIPFRQKFEPRVRLADPARFYQDGNLWSSAGISAGIDMALRIVISVWGEPTAKMVQSFLEYYPEPPFGPVDL
ncbi:DJ-1/PfpI family protein [Tundrisphaera sp. TA3]|uniref:DJ-1/PfpI family protein n=1 Tax=Tundrisphaera sp. TA3 TaxID=3435775 RepID=UPI003EBC76EA